MESKEITKKYRMAQWAEMLMERTETGETVREFCLRKGVRKDKYYYWQRLLRESAGRELMKLDNTAGLGAQGFTEVKLQARPATPLMAAGQNHVYIEAGRMRISAGREYPAEKLVEILMAAGRP